jgi:hypothetical protein
MNSNNDKISFADEFTRFFQNEADHYYLSLKSTFADNQSVKIDDVARFEIYVYLYYLLKRSIRLCENKLNFKEQSILFDRIKKLIIDNFSNLPNTHNTTIENIIEFRDSTYYLFSTEYKKTVVLEYMYTPQIVLSTFLTVRCNYNSILTTIHPFEPIKDSIAKDRLIITTSLLFKESVLKLFSLLFCTATKFTEIKNINTEDWESLQDEIPSMHEQLCDYFKSEIHQSKSSNSGCAAPVLFILFITLLIFI